MKTGGKKKPGAIVINGERWPVAVLVVTEFDPDGSPRAFRLLRDDESVHIEGGENFWTVYAPPNMTKRRN